jgi:hypothetical protein
MNNLIIEAIVVGIVNAILGYIIMKNIKNNIHALFITGIIFHLGSEYFGVNKWYCYNGHACKN